MKCDHFFAKTFETHNTFEYAINRGMCMHCEQLTEPYLRQFIILE